MSLRKGTPGRGAGSQFETFSYTPVGYGLKGAFAAYLAGEPYWCDEAHEYHKAMGPTQPCQHWITSGELDCPRCRKQPAVKKIAWVPLWREQDGQPILVIVHDSAADLLAGLRYPDCVLVGRVSGTSSVFVRKSDNGLSFKTENEARKRPVQIASQLVRLWRMPDLEAWLKRGAKGKGEPEQRAEVEPVKSDGKPFGAMTRAAALLYGDGDQGGASDVYADALREAVKRGTKPGTNGNGKHSAEGGKK